MMDDGLRGVSHVLKVRCKSPHQGWLVWMISGPAAASPAVAAVSAPCAIRRDARYAHPGRYVSSTIRTFSLVSTASGADH